MQNKNDHKLTFLKPILIVSILLFVIRNNIILVDYCIFRLWINSDIRFKTKIKWREDSDNFKQVISLMMSMGTKTTIKRIQLKKQSKRVLNCRKRNLKRQRRHRKEYKAKTSTKLSRWYSRRTHSQEIKLRGLSKASKMTNTKQKKPYYSVCKKWLKRAKPM